METNDETRRTLDDVGYGADVVLGAPVGMGSTARVLRGSLRSSGRAVAIKLLQPKHMTNPDIVGRFLREGELLRRLRSPHLPEVLAVGTTSSDQPYLVMTLLDGVDLDERLSHGGPVTIADAIRWVRHACEGLGHAHDEGVVHRDVKPSNLFLARRGNGATEVVVLDFGIAKSRVTAGLTATSPDLVMGTAPYMAPEQARASANVDARADVWALGVVLFELLTQELPFPGATALEVFAAALTHPTPRIGSLFGEVPAGLSAILEGCLAKRPADRFANAAELSRALAPLEALPASLGPVFVRPRADPAPALSAAAGAPRAAPARGPAWT